MSAPRISAIVAVARNGVIGKDNRLPWHISADLKYFRSMTMGKPVIMGRKCYESMGRPLPGRVNIVISRSGFRDDAQPDLRYAASVKDAVDLAAATSPSEIMIIGGAQIYAVALPMLDRLYLTQIERDYDGDTFMPDYRPNEWQVVSDEAQAGDPPFRFVTLDLKRPR